MSVLPPPTRAEKGKGVAKNSTFGEDQFGARKGPVAPQASQGTAQSQCQQELLVNHHPLQKQNVPEQPAVALLPRDASGRPFVPCGFRYDAATFAARGYSTLEAQVDGVADEVRKALECALDSVSASLQYEFYPHSPVPVLEQVVDE